MDDDNNQEESLQSSLSASVLLLKKQKIELAINKLQKLQYRISASDIVSKNEDLDDVATSSLPLFEVEHHLAMAILDFRPNNNKTSTSVSEQRKNILKSAHELFAEFLRRMESLGILRDEKELLRDYHSLLDQDEEMSSIINDDQNDNVSFERTMRRNRTNPGDAREIKIARFRQKIQIEKDCAHCAALKERRNRLEMEDKDEIDGLDLDALDRKAFLANLKHCVIVSLEEMGQGLKEMEMLDMAVKMEQGQNTMNLHRGSSLKQSNLSDNRISTNNSNMNVSSNLNNPMQVTKVTQDPKTGQLHFKREEIRTNVFRPHWNQPTMTLNELGDIEVADAMERAQKQKEEEAAALHRPRRYDQLERDGMEDCADLADASSKLDRDWDDFKDDNPRGIGNKLSERGDKNF